MRADDERPSKIQYNLLELPTTQRALRQLSTPVSFFWEHKPLRDGLQELCETYDISFWLDRRIDPGQLIEAKVNARDTDQSLESALNKIARAAQAEAALIENVVYIGPRNTTRCLQRAAVLLHDALSRAAPNSKAHMRGLRWGELATPNDLLARISTDWQVNVRGQLPHDLLHAGELAGQSSLATLLTIVCGGFDVEVNLLADGQFELTPLNKRERWQAVYPNQSLNSAAKEQNNLSRLLELYPRSNIRELGQQCEISATTNFHLALLKPAARRRANIDLNRQRWTFEVQNKPAQAVIQFFADSIGLEIEWDSQCSENDRTRLISFRVDNADIDALLRDFALASGLKVERDEMQVRIAPLR